MKILIGMDDDKRNIAVAKDYENIDNRGEIAHILCEIKIIEQELLELWESFDG